MLLRLVSEVAGEALRKLSRSRSLLESLRPFDCSGLGKLGVAKLKGQVTLVRHEHRLQTITTVQRVQKDKTWATP